MMMENALEDIAAAGAPAELLEEIRALQAEPLAQQGPFDIYLAPAAAIPQILLEIGRLRELTFRAVGVGVGKARDLDKYDEYYSHLFLWDRERRQVAGGYRLARTDLVLAEHGYQGLYTASLCECDEALLAYLNPALELGRSWVHPDYQRSLHSLLGLWKGVGHFVARYPRYHKLFGAVTISDRYTSVSQDIIVRFLRRTKTDGKWSAAMRALLPFKNHAEDRSGGLKSIEEVSAQVATQEADGKGIPVLLRQYFKLNATLLDFAYDPNFSDCLDAIVLVDLLEAPQILLKKYMGKEGQARFRAEMGAARK